MKRKKIIIESQAKSGSMIALVNQYTELLRNYLKTGKEKPNPRSFMDRYTKKSKKSELQAQLNMTTLLAIYGREQNQKALKAFESNNFLEKSKQKFFKNLIKKSSGAR